MQTSLPHDLRQTAGVKPKANVLRTPLTAIHSILRHHSAAECNAIGNIGNRQIDGVQVPLTTNLVASFAVVIAKDRHAITAIITEQWSNRQTEGHTTRLKLVKPQMFGRAKLDLLKARLLGAE